jgi:hypothetical protein
MATVGSGFIVFFYADTLFRTLISMLTTAIEALKAANIHLQQLLLFIDRGYLQFAKDQPQGSVTNLIQFLMAQECNFLGTIKDTPTFPFVIEQTRAVKDRVTSKRAVVQTYGKRSSFTAKKSRSKLKAVTFRHGMGKMRSARVATNAPGFQDLEWVYEVTSGIDANSPGGVQRIPHEEVPSALTATADDKAKTKHAFSTLLSTVWQVTREQHSADWFLARLFCFTSTSLHAAINCKSAVYFNTEEARNLHRDCLSIAQLKPRKSITVENVADDSEENEHGAPRKKPGGNKSLPSYWKNNFNAAQLKEEALKQKLTLPPGYVTKAMLADLLANAAGTENCSDHDEMSDEEDEDLEDQQEEVDKGRATIRFLQRMMPRWFIAPFQAAEGSATKTGSANEELVLDALPYFLKSKSRYHAKRKDITEYGLLANRKLRACATSVDGVVALRIKDTDSRQLGDPFLAAIEIKTKTSAETMRDLDDHIGKTGGESFVECEAGTPEFRDFIPEPSFRSQLCQHATSLGLNKVLMVYSVPGGVIKRVVLVHVSEAHQNAFLKLQHFLVEAHLSFAYGEEDEDDSLDIPSLGEDFTKPYGYACEHHTAELWARLWRLHSEDVIKNGTPPKCRRLVDLVVCMWNKFMGHVDVLRKVVRGTKTRRGPDSGPASLMWYTFLDYVLYNGFRLFQYVCMEDQLDGITSYSQMQSLRKSITFRNFLYKLWDDGSLTSENLASAFPGLRHMFDGDAHAAVSPVPPATTSNAEEVTSLHKSRKYTLLKHFLPLESRLTGTHTKVRLPQGERQKGCIACCKYCVKGQPHTNRKARETFWQCDVCKISLCKFCWEPFHTVRNFQAPACLGLEPVAQAAAPATRQGTRNQEATHQPPSPSGGQHQRKRKRRSISSSILY